MNNETIITDRRAEWRRKRDALFESLTSNARAAVRRQLMKRRAEGGRQLLQLAERKARSKYRTEPANSPLPRVARIDDYRRHHAR